MSEAPLCDELDLGLRLLVADCTEVGSHGARYGSPGANAVSAEQPGGPAPGR